MDGRKAGRDGSITLLVLVMMIVFAIMAGATIRYIALQSRLTTEQVQEEQVFLVADSGIEYVAWLVNPLPAGGGLLPQELPFPLLYEVTTAQEELVGTAHIEHSYNTMEQRLEVTSRGYDAQREDICQVIYAEISLQANKYEVAHWDHRKGVVCPGLPDED